MKIRVVPIDLQAPNGVALPLDPLVFQAAQKFCSEFLVERPILGNYQKTWLAIEVSDGGDLVRPLGITGYQLAYDIPLFRSIDSGATLKLARRLNDHFADLGIRGRDVFLHVSNSETEDQKCPQYTESMSAFGARPADRYIVRVT